MGVTEKMLYTRKKKFDGLGRLRQLEEENRKLRLERGEGTVRDETNECLSPFWNKLLR